jgi:hypothetical protein
LAYLEFKDPSKVKKIETFTGELDVKQVDLSAETDLLRDMLAGYPVDANAVVAAAFAVVETLQDATTLSVSTLPEFLRVDKVFACHYGTTLFVSSPRPTRQSVHCD